MKSGRAWPIGVALVLALTVVANIGIYVVATDDPTFVIEPNYYAKAIGWDSTMAQDRRSALLGWVLTPEAKPSHAGRAALTLRLADASGRPLGGARVHMEGVNNADPAGAVAMNVVADANGVAATSMPVRHGGLWELRFDVRRGSDRFTTVRRVEIVTAK